MQPKTICQSCSMPIDDIAVRGTEKDGSKSSEYCKYCYEKGAFISPDLSLDQMKTIVKTELEKRQSSPDIIQHAVDSLPHLKRWQKTTAR